MKILVLSANPFKRNGVSNVIFNYISSMDMTGVQMDAVSMNQPDETYSCIMHEKGIDCYIIERSVKKIFQRWYKLFKLIKVKKYDAIHLHGNSHLLVLELSAAWAAGCKVRIVHSHSTKCKSPFIHKLLSPLFNRLCTHRIACGNAAGEWMFGSHEFEVINNGINIDRYTYNQDVRLQYRSEFNWSEGNIVVGHVGNFYDVKNHKFLIDVFKELHSINKDYRLLLLGDGVLRNDIETQIKKYGLSNEVILAGSVSNVFDYLNAIDCIAMPSLFEGLPLSLMEQQANGLQCFVSDTISKESNKTSFVKFLPLNSSAKEWAMYINSEVDKINRAERSKLAKRLITESGYNIFNEAQKLKQYYFNTLIEEDAE